MHIRLIYKLETKLANIKNQSQWYKKSPEAKKKKYTKLKNFHKNMHSKRVYDLTPPHLNLTMSSLGADESLLPQKHTKTKKTKSRKNTKSTHIYTS